MLIFPAIDIYDGKCVRLRQGDYAQQTIYADSPVEPARQFSDAGFHFLHVVDLEGAKEKRLVNVESVRRILEIPGISVEIGGGIRTTDDVQRLLDLGVSRVVVGSIAVQQPDLAEIWLNRFGADRIVIGIDVKQNSVAISGWLEDGGLDPVACIGDFIRRGASTFICTDISRDGMLSGTDSNFYKRLTSAFPKAAIIASGGIATMADIHALPPTGVAGVVVGKSLYEGTITLKELSAVASER
jgi:phosphoribosylformimino-5-aminoimidazole carboxamide ribotide isomerase